MPFAGNLGIRRGGSANEHTSDLCTTWSKAYRQDKKDRHGPQHATTMAWGRQEAGLVHNSISIPARNCMLASRF